jgi:hypothetical protein
VLGIRDGIRIGISYGMLCRVPRRPGAGARSASVHVHLSKSPSGQLPLDQLDLQSTTAALRLRLIVVIVIAEMHQLAHATTEAMGEVIQGALIVLTRACSVLKRLVLVSILVLVLFLPDEVPKTSLAIKCKYDIDGLQAFN